MENIVLTMSLYERIQAISNEVRNLSKDMTVGEGSYQYKAISDLSVTLAVKDAETKYGIVSIPIRQELMSQEILKGDPDKYGKVKITYSDTIKMTVRLFKVEATQSGNKPIEGIDYIDIETMARGIDTSDKSFGKASTYARKYALLNAYKIATGEDPDAEKSEETTIQNTPDEKRLAVMNYLNSDIDRKNKVIAHFAVLDIDGLTDVHISEIWDSYKTRGLI